jgi:hypothetical protein
MERKIGFRVLTGQGANRLALRQACLKGSLDALGFMLDPAFPPNTRIYDIAFDRARS